VVAASDECEHDLVALLMRGDHELNAVKAEKLPRWPARCAWPRRRNPQAASAPDPAAWVRSKLPIPCIVDRQVALMSDFGAGANVDDKHYFGINWGATWPA
jgi:prolyl-tRNA synthetase